MRLVAREGGMAGGVFWWDRCRWCVDRGLEGLEGGKWNLDVGIWGDGLAGEKTCVWG